MTDAPFCDPAALPFGPLAPFDLFPASETPRRAGLIASRCREPTFFDEAPVAADGFVPVFVGLPFLVLAGLAFDFALVLVLGFGFGLVFGFDFVAADFVTRAFTAATFFATFFRIFFSAMGAQTSACDERRTTE